MPFLGFIFSGEKSLYRLAVRHNNTINISEPRVVYYRLRLKVSNRETSTLIDSIQIRNCENIFFNLCEELNGVFGAGGTLRKVP